MKVLVTGGGGFIGSHVVRRLLAGGHEVHALVRSTAGLDRIGDIVGAGRVTLWPVDLLDGPAVDAVVAAIGAEGAVHLAWYAEPGSYLRDVPRNLASLEAGLHLLRALATGPTRRLVLAGTCLETPAPAPAAADEPVYAVTKRALHDIAAAATSAELGVACAHVFSVFGPGEDPRRGLPSVIRSLLEGQPVDVGRGEQLRDYVHVTDVAAALVDVLESDVVGGIDVCRGEARPLRDVFEQVGRATGAGHLLRIGARPESADEVFDAVGDASALRALGWRPTAPLAAQIDETVAWWRARLPLPAASGATR